MALYGILGQLQGPFDAGTNIVNIIKAEYNRVTGEILNPVFVKLGLSIAEKDHMIFTMPIQSGDQYPQSFQFIIRQQGEAQGQTFWLGKTQIYESDDGLEITELSFPQGAPASVLIDYVILDRG